MSEWAHAPGGGAAVGLWAPTTVIFLLRVLLWGGYAPPRLARHRAGTDMSCDEGHGADR